jgi:hypothetical protein
MPQGNLTGIAYQEIESDSDKDIDGHVVGHINIIVLEEDGEKGEEQHEKDEPKNHYARRKELDILVVVPFHVHGRCLQNRSKGLR